ncbi:MAG: C10 family peptidase [Lentimicrobium sp.]
MKTILFTLFVLVASCVFANPVDVKTASLVAENYYNSNAKVKASDLSLTYQEVTNTGDTAIYYVFNINQSDGWIIVAATDASYPVLGYSPSGNYSKQDQPPAFIYWMEGYKNQILDIIRRRISPTTEINAEWATYKNINGGTSNKSPLSVGPLLSTTWNQGQYYNAWCPGGCPTGCVATAMAQIMKYWASPAVGTGDHCYQHPAYGQLCANFGSTTYNWNAMPNNVTSSNTPVATLMYHCGVSVNMDYCQNGSNASGAWVLTNDPNGYHPNSAQNAYSAYFGYNSSTIQGKLRVSYSESYWINSIIKPELDASTPRPIQYVGWDINGQGGHTWVCDGYNSNNLFHMNWGWGGMNDGWFNLNTLNPGIYYFDNGQQALIGIQPGMGGGQLPNDDCGYSATMLASGTNCNYTPGTVAGATSSGISIPNCSGYQSQTAFDVWFKFDAVCSEHTITVDPEGNTTGNNNYLDAVLGLYSSCSSSGFLECFDQSGSGGVTTTYTFSGLTPGETYYIRVFDYGNSQPIYPGFNICVTHSGGSSGDDFNVQNQTVTPASVAAGGAIDVSASQCYSGTTPDASMGSVYLGYYLSPTPTFNSSTAVYLDEDPSGLGSDDPCNSESETLTIPTGTSSGTYYLLFFADHDNAFVETDENNNVVFIQITVTGGSSGDDFYVQNQTATPASVAAGGAIDVSASQCYSGTTPDASMGSVYLGYYLSPTPTFNSSTAVYLDEDPSGLGSDDPCNSESETLTIPTGTSSGTYYLLFFADHDNAFVETDENNNVVSIQITVTGGSSGDDFYVQNQTATPASVAAGGAIDVSASQCYSGTTPDASMGSVYLGYYLSPTPTFNSSTAVYLDEDPSGLGSDDPCNSESETLTIPTGTSSGTYYLLYFADHVNAYVETNENNNITYVQINVIQSSYTISTVSSPANGGTTSGGGTFLNGAYATVSASQNNGYTFANWTENGNVVSISSSYSFNVTSNRTLVANFVQNPLNYTVTTQSSPSNGGTTSGGGTYPSGTYITVSASQNNGYTFANWTENGNVVSISSSYSFNVTANRELVANFTQNPVNYTVTTQSFPSTGGTTSGGGIFPSGTYITVSASQHNGYTFANWTENGNVVSIGSSYSFYVTSNRTLVANFTQNPVNYTVTTQSSPSNGGTTSGGGIYPSGTYITVSASQNNGYTFANWTENGNVVSIGSSYSFTVSASRVLVANFTANSHDTTMPTFAKLYDDFNDLCAFNCVSDFSQSPIDSSYLVGGTYSYTGSSNDGFYFYKVNKNGTLIWVKEIPYTNTLIHCIVKSVNGYMISFGINNEAAIMEVNESGNVLWSKKLDLYIQNFTTTQGGYIGTYSFMNTVNLVKLDFDGNLIWSKVFSYDNPDDEYVYCEKLASDYYGNIYLLGRIQNPNFFSSQNGIIQKVSSDGNPIWCRQIFTYDDYRENLTSLVIDKYSNLYFGMSTNDNSGEPSNGYIGKLNSSGVLSSLKQLPVSDSPELFSISQTGDVVQAWYARDFQTTILLLNTSLELIDLKTFEYHGLKVAKSTLDNNIMLGGCETVNRLNGSNDIHFNMFKVSMNQSSCITAQQQTMVLTNSSLSVNPLAVSSANSGIALSDFIVGPVNATLLDSIMCDDSGLITSTNKIIPVAGDEDKFSIFPNPNSGQFTLKSIDLKGDKYRVEIIDLTGRIEKQLTINAVDGKISKTISVDDLPGGIYMLRISSSCYNQSLKLIIQ